MNEDDPVIYVGFEGNAYDPEDRSIANCFLNAPLIIDRIKGARKMVLDRLPFSDSVEETKFLKKLLEELSLEINILD